MNKKGSGRLILIGFFIISYSYLLLELLISRVMSAVAWYHFAFMAICLALFGLTLGGVIVHRQKERYLNNFSEILSSYAIGFSLSCLWALFIISHKPLFYNLSGDWQLKYHYGNMILIFLSVSLPFVFAGVCISLIFTKFASSVNKIYCINLIASALGCLLFIPSINYLGAFNVFILLGLLGVIAAFLFSIGTLSKYPRMTKVIVVLFILMTGLLAFNLQHNILDFRWTKGQLDSGTLYKKWNAFSYLRLIPRGESIPFGWGFAPKKMGEIYQQRIDQVYLDIDGIAGTTMTRFDGDLEKIKFLKYDVTALPYYLVNNGDILVIGVGAGRDVLTALVFHQKKITGVEINGGILYMLNDLMGEFSGRLKHYSQIKFVNDEARSYVASVGEQYDLIQISLIDTFAASLAGAYTLTENSLYTQEAFTTYLRHLKDRGFLSVSYWFHLNEPQYILKLIGVATKALQKLGIHDTRNHMVVVHKTGQKRAWGVATLLVKKDAFHKQDLVTIENFCEEMGFNLILSPESTTEEAFALMADSRTLDLFAKQYPLNIAPPTDDIPFFFIFHKLLKENIANFKSTGFFSAEGILSFLLIFMGLLTFFLIFLPLRRSIDLNLTHRQLLSFALYFSFIGLAFMLIEVSQMTRLSIFLGHPIYSLAIVLFALLVTSGLGSYLIGKIDDIKELSLIFLIFIIVCAIFVIFTPALMQNFSQYGVLTRLLISVVLIAPLGFFMGSFLPQGIKLLNNYNGPVALFWGLSGAMSVIGSILAMIFLITLGIKLTFLIGVFLYLLAMATILRLGRYNALTQ